MEEFKNKIKAIIFDMDGTIIKTEDAWQKITLGLLAQYGINDLTEDQKALLQSFSGMGMKSVAEQLKLHFNLEHDLETIIMHKTTLANKVLADHIEFIEGFELFHARLQELNIPTSIATNAMPDNLQALSQQLGFERFFGANLFSQADVNYRAKPDPALFLHAAEMLGVKPEECLVFEDSMPGFMAARAAGMKCIAIKNDLNHSFLENVHEAIENYHEAEEALKKI
jgi:beta-phosphoglucomutase